MSIRIKEELRRIGNVLNTQTEAKTKQKLNKRESAMRNSRKECANADEHVNFVSVVVLKRSWMFLNVSSYKMESVGRLHGTCWANLFLWALEDLISETSQYDTLYPRGCGSLLEEFQKLKNCLRCAAKDYKLYSSTGASCSRFYSMVWTREGVKHCARSCGDVWLIKQGLASNLKIQ